MKRYERYINGQTKQVYEEIHALGQDAFLPGNLKEIELIMTETFQRVAYNLEIIYKELKEIGYLFKEDAEFNFEKPLHSPLPETNLLLQQLDDTVKPFGFVPLSLKFFYEIVGGVNFVWDYETSEDFMWTMADPIQVASLDAVVETVTDEYWKEEIQLYLDEEDFEQPCLEIAADDLHKDNVSGGPAYAIQITPKPSVDSLFINEPNNTSFIDYLRICFENCGFPGITRHEQENNYKAFFQKVKAQMKPI